MNRELLIIHHNTQLGLVYIRGCMMVPRHADHDVVTTIPHDEVGTVLAPFHLQLCAQNELVYLFNSVLLRMGKNRAGLYDTEAA